MLKQKEMPAVGEKIAVIKTDKGDIKVRLFPEEAPKAVENFVTHAENGYYDGLIFHRVIKDFMIQGGDPKGTGTGGESISVSDDLVDQLETASEKLFPLEAVREYENNGGTPWLDYHHTVFGQVFERMDVVDDIANVKVDFFQNKPLEDVKIQTIEIVEN